MSVRRPGLRVRLREDLDTWGRHATVAGLLEGVDGPVLDVGGVAGRLAPFLPGREVVAANVSGPADVVFDGQVLPFDGRSFAAAVSLDVLEHVEPARRAGHVAELARIAERRLVLCCPLGTPAHAAAERELAAWYGDLGGVEPFLDEHLANGLPTEEELRSVGAGLEGGWTVRLAFQGDHRVAERVFRDRALAHFRRRPADRVRYLATRLRAPVPLSLDAAAGEHANRAFLLGDRR